MCALGFRVVEAEDISELDLAYGWAASMEKLRCREQHYRTLFGEAWVQRAYAELQIDTESWRSGREGNGRIVADGPFAEGKEAVGGYFLLRVDGGGMVGHAWKDVSQAVLLDAESQPLLESLRRLLEDQHLQSVADAADVGRRTEEPFAAAHIQKRLIEAERLDQRSEREQNRGLGG